MTYNVALLRKVKEQIQAQPWTWYQGDWRSPLLTSLEWREDLAETERRSGGAFWKRIKNQWGMTRTELGKWRKRLEKEQYCGSAYCVAGWATTFVDGPEAMDGQNRIKVEGQRIRVHVEDRAQELLGLSEDEAAVLFDGSNGYTRVINLLDLYIAQGEKEMTA